MGVWPVVLATLVARQKLHLHYSAEQTDNNINAPDNSVTHNHKITEKLHMKLFLGDKNYDLATTGCVGNLRP